MTAIVEKYGTVLRLYDNGGKTLDRYTVLPPRWASDYRERPGLWACFFSGDDPAGMSGHGSAAAGPHLGKRIHWQALPAAVQKIAADTFPEYAPDDTRIAAGHDATLETRAAHVVGLIKSKQTESYHGFVVCYLAGVDAPTKSRLEHTRVFYDGRALCQFIHSGKHAGACALDYRQASETSDALKAAVLSALNTAPETQLIK